MAAKAQSKTPGLRPGVRVSTASVSERITARRQQRNSSYLSEVDWV